MAVIVFANQKGGVGKSTLSCHFAWWLAENGAPRVLLVDLDAQGNASRTLAARAAPVRSTALFGAGDLAGAVPAAEGLTLLAADSALADVELAAGAPGVFVRQLASVAQPFDAVVVDTPPALGRRMIAALVAADFVVCPIELEAYSIDALANMLKTIHAVRARWNPRLRLLGVLANRFNHHSGAQKAALAALLSRYAEFVLPVRVATRSAIAEAVGAGVPVWRLPRSSAREAAAELGQVFRLLRARMAADESTPQPAPVSADA